MRPNTERPESSYSGTYRRWGTGSEEEGKSLGFESSDDSRRSAGAGRKRRDHKVSASDTPVTDTLQEICQAMDDWRQGHLKLEEELSSDLKSLRDDLAMYTQTDRSRQLVKDALEKIETRVKKSNCDTYEVSWTVTNRCERLNPSGEEAKRNWETELHCHSPSVTASRKRAASVLDPPEVSESVPVDNKRFSLGEMYSAIATHAAEARAPELAGLRHPPKESVHIIQGQTQTQPAPNKSWRPANNPEDDQYNPFEHSTGSAAEGYGFPSGLEEPISRYGRRTYARMVDQGVQTSSLLPRTRTNTLSYVPSEAELRPRAVSIRTATVVKPLDLAAEYSQIQASEKQEQAFVGQRAKEREGLKVEAGNTADPGTHEENRLLGLVDDEGQHMPGRDEQEEEGDKLEFGKDAFEDDALSEGFSPPSSPGAVVLYRGQSFGSGKSTDRRTSSPTWTASEASPRRDSQDSANVQVQDADETLPGTQTPAHWYEVSSEGTYDIDQSRYKIRIVSLSIPPSEQLDSLGASIDVSPPLPILDEPDSSGQPPPTLTDHEQLSRASTLNQSAWRPTQVIHRIIAKAGLVLLLLPSRLVKHYIEDWVYIWVYVSYSSFAIPWNRLMDACNTLIRLFEPGPYMDLNGRLWDNYSPTEDYTEWVLSLLNVLWVRLTKRHGDASYIRGIIKSCLKKRLPPMQHPNFTQVERCATVYLQCKTIQIYVALAIERRIWLHANNRTSMFMLDYIYKERDLALWSYDTGLSLELGGLSWSEWYVHWVQTFLAFYLILGC